MRGAPAPAVRAPELELIGAHAFTSAQVRVAIAGVESPLLDEHGALDSDALEREMLLISAFYWDRGYVNVKVGAPRYDRERGVISVPVDEGQRFTMGSITITGELLASEASHLAMIRVRPGMVFSRKMIATDREALSTFYADRSYAYVTVLPLTKIDLDAKTIDLTFEIERGQPATFERIDVVAKTPAGEAAIRNQLAVSAGQPYNETRLLGTKQRALALGLFRDIAISTKRGSRDDLVVASIEEVE